MEFLQGILSVTFRTMKTLAVHPIRRQENSSKCNNSHQAVLLKICLHKMKAGFLTLTLYGFILKLCMWGRPGRTDVGVTPKLCLWDGLWDWAEGLINRSCEAEVIYIISLTRPEINDSLLYMSFITLNLLLLFSSLKLYAHTHAQIHQVHETSYYVVNTCNYDGDGVGQKERDRDGRT